MIDLRRSADRATTVGDALTSRHSFSYAKHFDPANTSFGCLLANNHDRLPVGGGFDPHRHRDVEIVTWVLSGRLQHSDSAGAVAVLGAGMAQRLSAGSGVIHAEHNDPTATESVDYVQMWLIPDVAGGQPSYAVADLTESLSDGGGWVLVASGNQPAPLPVRQSAASLWVARPAEEQRLSMPEDCKRAHLYVAAGRVTLLRGVEGKAVTLQPGDAARVSDESSLRLRAAAAAELLLWTMRG